MRLPTVPPTSLLQPLPKKVVGALAAGLGFAAIGIINVASFTLNKTADAIAWITDDSREKSWAPFVFAILILAFLAQLLIRKLLQDQSTNEVNTTFTPEQMKAVTEYSTKTSPAQTQPTPNPALNAFPSDGELAKNFKRAGSKLFSQPTSSSSPTPPSARASTRPPTPVCAGQKPNSTLYGPPTSPSFITPPSARASTPPPSLRFN